MRWRDAMGRCDGMARYGADRAMAPMTRCDGAYGAMAAPTARRRRWRDGTGGAIADGADRDGAVRDGEMARWRRCRDAMAPIAR